ncbi:hypothetical protein ACCD10_32750, partial [Pseudomonas sp. Pseusp122]|uniref:hypothetical protein n=1 Tax=unclassified Pseudomonas TaxID=196821 RepID=UPI0039A42171
LLAMASDQTLKLVRALRTRSPASRFQLPTSDAAPRVFGVVSTLLKPFKKIPAHFEDFPYSAICNWSLASATPH